MRNDERRSSFFQKNILPPWCGIILNATGLFNEILEPGLALYASIAKQIALSNNWINLYGDGSDWLDKPHFLSGWRRSV
jgi:hypothetical protein